MGKKKKYFDVYKIKPIQSEYVFIFNLYSQKSAPSKLQKGRMTVEVTVAYRFNIKYFRPNIFHKIQHHENPKIKTHISLEHCHLLSINYTHPKIFKRNNKYGMKILYLALYIRVDHFVQTCKSE